ncbi:SusC/RagA family TonB-linked outer membrane protein [Polaribacter sp. Hel1_85]|uniref:SusC/RagA family TonB-linked outer membrane protein n=1 Tax=Polaribacter sp. Hel1_85 TaxID=1250005 RepID=UPI00052DDE52|nr:TonB-dependent receptor [Polaribacter sp. Hel1_85]KGL61789.1 TonB-dependent receptor, plug [Polaribacter sp. Hel1_85]
MNLKIKLVFMAMLLVSAINYAQESITVKGSVTSESDGQPILGANIIIVGTTTGTSTDFDGNYSVKVKSGDVLQFSYIGFATKSVTVTDQKTINVVLAEDANALDEIVVVGYGTRKKSHLTGSISKIGGKDVAAVQTSRVDEAMAGKLAGVLIQNASGEPGADPKIQIRAASSISSNSNPLIVVDGFPISGSLATVNPNDIESLEILKDAASAAIYGSRGANGVVLVTTKKGKTGAPKFSYNTYTSFSNKYRDNILKTGSEWAAISRAEIAAGNWDVSQIDADFLEYRLTAYEESPDEVSVEDWLYQTGNTTSHDFSMSGGTEDVKYFASVGYQNTTGIIRTQGFERLNARLNVDANLGDKFKAGVSFNGFTSDRQIVGWDVRDLSRATAIHPIYHTAASIAFVQDLDKKAQALGLKAFDNGKNSGATTGLGYNQSIYTLEPGDFVNDWHYGRENNGIGGSGDQGPATKLDNTEITQKTYFANINSYLQYNILEGLNIKTVLGGDFRDTQDYYWRGLISDGKGRGSATNLDQTDVKVSSVLSETTLNYTKEIGKHNISAVAGVEFQTTTFKGSALDGTNVPNTPVINFNLLLPADIAVTERDEKRARESVFGRVNYAYDDKYLASVSVRRDGDSRFGANEKYATFPAISLGWNIHKEDFLADNETISKLKLRASRGSLGTASFLESYSSLSLLSPTATAFGVGFQTPSDIANPDLTWQTNTETNYGVDFGILNNRFTFGVDHYTSDIEDILINYSISEINGTSARKLNTGDVESSGWEFELSAGVIQKEDFNWNVSANLSTVNTEITSLGGLDELPREGAGQSDRNVIFRNYVGGQIGEMWALQTAGQVEMIYLEDGTRSPNNTTGEYYVIDQQSEGEEGYGEIDNTRTVEEGGDLVKVGQNTPDFYWGLNTSMNYKEFDLSMQFQGAQGAEVYNVDPYYYGSQWGGRLVDNFKDSDGKAVHNGMFVKGAKDNIDANIQDASYLALRNITIGYTLKQDLVERIGLSSVRIYGAATNLLYIMADDYTSYNPEGIETTGDYTGPTTSGFQVGASPVVRSFTLGLNLNF